MLPNFLNKAISTNAILIPNAYSNAESAVTRRYATIPTLKLPQINDAKLNGATGNNLMIMRKVKGFSDV